MPILDPSPGRYADDRSGSTAVFGTILVGDDLDVPDHIGIVHGQRPPSACGVIDGNPVDNSVIVTKSMAVYRAFCSENSSKEARAVDDHSCGPGKGWNEYFTKTASPTTSARNR